MIRISTWTWSLTVGCIKPSFKKISEQHPVVSYEIQVNPELTYLSVMSPFIWRPPFCFPVLAPWESIGSAIGNQYHSLSSVTGEATWSWEMRRCGWFLAKQCDLGRAVETFFGWKSNFKCTVARRPQYTDLPGTAFDLAWETSLGNHQLHWYW